MCDCVSWLRHTKTGRVLFLRDDEAKTLIDDHHSLADLTGHSSIFRYNKIDPNSPETWGEWAGYEQLENTPTKGGPRIPSVIAKAINRGELKELLTAWYDVNKVDHEYRTYKVTTRGQWVKTQAEIVENRERLVKTGLTTRTKYIRLVGYHDPDPESVSGYANWNIHMTPLVEAGAVLPIHSVITLVASRDPISCEPVTTGGVYTRVVRGAHVHTNWAWGRQCYVPATKQEYDDFWRDAEL